MGRGKGLRRGRFKGMLGGRRGGGYKVFHEVYVARSDRKGGSDKSC